ncbi:uncharacterized protein VTP21DRAFT_2105 [Calcarisporiella thermophila]|uniref:uncharacterized protein n=1 Tax=Calcarisporiella thermophila TaxID=911321 RepID=UPI0037428CD7
MPEDSEFIEAESSKRTGKRSRSPQDAAVSKKWNLERDLQNVDDTIERYRMAIDVLKEDEDSKAPADKIKALIKEKENEKEELEALLESTSTDSEIANLEHIFAVDEAFRIEYQDPHNALAHFKEYLYWCHRERNRQSITVTPFIPIVQSSGYGKTRMIAELANEIHTIYICNRARTSSGYPPASPQVRYIFSQLDRQDVSEIQPFAWIMLAAAQEVKDCWLSPGKFWRMQIYDRTACTSFWKKVLKRYEDYTIAMKDELKVKLNDDSFIFNLFGNNRDKEEIKLLCCIDEAHMLFDEAKDRELGNFNVKFRMWLRAIHSIRWRGFFSVCISTCSKIGDIFLSFEYDTSAREVPFMHFQPFVDVATKDALVPGTHYECPTPLQLVRFGHPLFGALAKDESYLSEV